MKAMRCVSLPEDLCGAAEEKFGHRYGTIDELLSTVIAELLREDAEKMDENEQRTIEERLKGLGYI